MKWCHSIKRRVEFSDTDMAGVVHFSRYFTYMQCAEHDFFRKLGFSINHKYNGHHYGWPRGTVNAKFLRPLEFDDEIEIRVQLNKVKKRTLEFNFVIIKCVDESIAATGSFTTICVIHEADGSMHAAVIPPILLKTLQNSESKDSTHSPTATLYS
jgi:acyl-CoA thioester hydrolase